MKLCLNIPFLFLLFVQGESWNLEAIFKVNKRFNPNGKGGFQSARTYFTVFLDNLEGIQKLPTIRVKHSIKVQCFKYKTLLIISKKSTHYCSSSKRKFRVASIIDCQVNLIWLISFDLIWFVPCPKISYSLKGLIFPMLILSLVRLKIYFTGHQISLWKKFVFIFIFKSQNLGVFWGRFVGLRTDLQ